MKNVNNLFIINNPKMYQLPYVPISDNPQQLQIFTPLDI